MAVSLSVANELASLPIAYRLYLPQAWAEDPERRRQAKVPAEVVFQTKPEIALDQIAAAKARGVAAGTILADAGYGADGSFRSGLSALGLAYVVGVQPTLSVWPPGEGPLSPKPWSGKGQPPSLVRRSPDKKPVSVARRHQRRSRITLCRRTSAACFPRLQSIRTAARGVVDGQMARRYR